MSIENYTGKVCDWNRDCLRCEQMGVDVEKCSFIITDFCCPKCEESDNCYASDEEEK